MQITGLKLVGFKSFVDPSEVHIESGLTGIVGPNGCGKSNVLEALRWVMGASSAKALRGEDMEDVIFAGAANRPPRDNAEVTMVIDNSDRRAPAAFNESETIEIVRKIRRGAGSSYRINGREARAKDVTILFADASTGANSPALVRQGQISELISAKPENRRKVLEEAAGVGGMHARRHEAELKLKGAEANLERLEDARLRLEESLTHLRKQARQAERYRLATEDIRALEAFGLHARWKAAADTLEAASGESRMAEGAVADTAAAAAAASSRALETEAALKPLRDEEITAAAILRRIEEERVKIDAQLEKAESELRALQSEIARLQEEQTREEALKADAAAAIVRLTEEEEALALAQDAPEEARAQLAQKVEAADVHLKQAEADLDVAQTAAAERKAAREAREEELQGSANALRKATASLEANQAALAKALNMSVEEGALEAAQAEVERLEGLRDEASELVEQAEAALAPARQKEHAALEVLRHAQSRVSALAAEIESLTNVLAEDESTRYPPIMEQVRVAPGCEAAVAALFGDELEAAIDISAPLHWGETDVPPHPIPFGFALTDLVTEYPRQLLPRLRLAALVDRLDGPRLQSQLPPGGRLVSREGDLWRWDGFTRMADAPAPAAARLAARARREAAEIEIETAKAQIGVADGHAQIAIRAREAAEGEAKNARKAAPATIDQLERARNNAARAERELERKHAEADRLKADQARYIEAVDDAKERAQAAELASGGPETPEQIAALQAARDGAREARNAAVAARGELSSFDSAAKQRAARRLTVGKEIKDWSGRSETADKRLAQIARNLGLAQEKLPELELLPDAIAEKRDRLQDDIDSADNRRKAAGDALAAAETAAREAQSTLRASEAAASAAREMRAAAEARLEGAKERVTVTLNACREELQQEPEDLPARWVNLSDAENLSLHQAEERLNRTRRERDSLGAVNLAAEDEANETQQKLDTMNEERGDLLGAIAKLREAIGEINTEARDRLQAAYTQVNGHFQTLFQTLFEGGMAELKLTNPEDPLEAGLEIYACPPGKRLGILSLMSGGEQALTATALIFAVFLSRPAPICVLDEVDAPLDDANVDRYCRMLEEMRKLTNTRFMVITHNPVTMSRMDRLFGVTMPERGVSQLVSVDLANAERLVAAA
ncbi:MAG: AAA family ATPase [Caulobacterales bacterium]